MNVRGWFGLALLGLGLWPSPLRCRAPPFAFPPMEGWTLAGQQQVFSPDTLYDYINGGSDLYLKYEFEELTVVEYRKGAISVSAEVYRHRDPDHAFGIYSQERAPSAEFLAIGSQGYYERAACSFIQGAHYVKLSGENTGADDREILLRLARRISENLPGPAALPNILAAFPTEGKKGNAEKFIAKDFLGYAFLHAGFTADYDRSGHRYQLFVIVGSGPDDARAMLGQYLKQGKREAPKGEGAYQVTDPYHGDVALFWKGKHIWGTIKLTDPNLRAAYLKYFEGIADAARPSSSFEVRQRAGDAGLLRLRRLVLEADPAVVSRLPQRRRRSGRSPPSRPIRRERPARTSRARVPRDPRPAGWTASRP